MSKHKKREGNATEIPHMFEHCRTETLKRWLETARDLAARCGGWNAIVAQEIENELNRRGEGEEAAAQA